MPSPADADALEAPSASPTPAVRPARHHDSTRRARWVALPAITVAALFVVIVATAAGKYFVPPEEVVRLLAGQILPIERTWYDREQSVVLDVRLPRVLLSFLVGAGLAVSGAVLQAVFRNPLVSPQFIGVSTGASFGGVLAILFGLGTVHVVGGAFVCGIVALALVLSIGRMGSTSPLLMIVLGGVVVSAFFSALVSFVAYIADPYTTLPTITFWLMGSLAGASYAKAVTVLIPLAIGGVLIFALRWRLNVLSLGDEDARALGVSPSATRSVLLVAVALVTAGSVAVSGVIGWVGLIVPHIARLLVGSDSRVLLPASFLVGGGYLTLIDTLSRTIADTELPVGILTAVIGAPFFVILLARFRKKVWIGD
ncbi:iron ABC transporter permease [Microbacterium sp. NPDC096154]|uniref:FecCD family ABC transporter permease n=1 Tax=Microbacterium sp. NPDC096154 TaxID=3155549 RepID=UPI00331D3036